jgi:uracil-DNA glycosylase family 4
MYQLIDKIKDILGLTHPIPDNALANTIQEDPTSFGEYGKFFYEWNNCTKCRLHEVRRNPCVGNGKLYAPSLFFIGEAPGPSEDSEGLCFIGKSGKFLKKTIDKVGIKSEKCYFTNTVGCIPKDLKNSKFRAPTQSEIISCFPRLKYLYDNIGKNADCIVLLGKPAYIIWLILNNKIDIHEYSSEMSKTKMINHVGWIDNDSLNSVYLTYHPSYIIRMEDSGFKKEYQKWIYDFVVIKKYITTGKLKIVRE